MKPNTNFHSINVLVLSSTVKVHDHLHDQILKVYTTNYIKLFMKFDFIKRESLPHDRSK